MKYEERKQPVELLRQIGLTAAVAFAVGAVIGSGIFRKPGVMAAQLGSPALLILVWVVAGIMTLFGALSIAEISGMFHEAGGQYIYFNKCYSPFVGYLYGWRSITIAPEFLLTYMMWSKGSSSSHGVWLIMPTVTVGAAF